MNIQSSLVSGQTVGLLSSVVPTLNGRSSLGPLAERGLSHHLIPEPDLGIHQSDWEEF